MKTMRAGLVAALMFSVPAVAQIQVEHVGRVVRGGFMSGASEIPTYDPVSRQLYVVNAETASVDIMGISDPSNPTFISAINIAPWGSQPNSVSMKNGVLAVAVEVSPKQLPGKVVFFDRNGNYLNHVEVGAGPDMLTYSPDGDLILVANEGEPDTHYLMDPEGSVSIIDVSNGIAGLTQANVRTAGFTQFNNGPLDPGVRIYGPGATVASALEPESITVSHDGQTAWVTLQEANAVGILDIPSATFTAVKSFGTKDHSLPGNEFDASDRDGAINIRNWPTKGMYQPDTIHNFRFHGQSFIVTANEGDSRDWSAFSEETRVGSLPLDPTVFPNAADLKKSANLGRLKTTTVNGDTDGDGDYDEIWSLGARSFSIWDAAGNQVYDSGSDFERITAARFPNDFNSNSESGTPSDFDGRSDDKGPEPEGMALGKAFGKYYAFVGLERMCGIMVYNVTNPYAPEFVDYINTRNFQGDPTNGTAGDLAPEGMLFIQADDSPTGKPLLVVGNEISGSTSIYEITKKKN